MKTYLVGPKDGKKLLLVHGISTPAPVWKSIIPQLVQAGYRVLIFDLYGRGLSDAPILPYDIPLYVSQISFLLTSKPDWEKFSIGGMSLGGSIGESGFPAVDTFPSRNDLREHLTRFIESSRSLRFRIVVSVSKIPLLDEFELTFSIPFPLS